MRAFSTDHAVVDLPPRHRFPMGKYARLREALVREGILAAASITAADPSPLEPILAVHDADYVHGFLAGQLDRKAQQRIGFPWSEALVRRTLVSTGATLLAVEHALEHGFAGNLAGGTHHAYRDAGSGFCVFNDLAVAAAHLLATGRVRRILVFDVDVHQGDGTAAMCAADERVFTASLHGARNFPSRKQVSDLDVPLDDETRDGPYLAALDAALAEAFERARPDFVLIQGGVDVLATDKLGRLALTQAGCLERDRRVLAAACARGVPAAITLGGGYGVPIETSLEAHVGTWRAIVERYGSS